MIRAAILVSLSLSIGWGVRGNFGHEYGAMLPGALAALAGVLVFGQRDWVIRLGLRRFYFLHASDRLYPFWTLA
jgi:hypothetical protein